MHSPQITHATTPDRQAMAARRAALRRNSLLVHARLRRVAARCLSMARVPVGSR